jgi:ABC-type cobalt transport system substrate-binding protein
MSSSKIAESDSGAEDDIAPAYMYVYFIVIVAYSGEIWSIVCGTTSSLSCSIIVYCFCEINCIEKSQRAKLRVDENS